MAGSSLATGPVSGAGQGVMPAQVLAGPIWWFVTGVYVLTLLFALFVAIDSRRATRRERLAALPEPGWLYTGLAIAYLVVGLAAWITVPAAWRWIAAVPVLLTPVQLVAGFAYLLRVVYPKPTAGAAGPDAPDSLDAEPSSETPAPPSTDEPTPSENHPDDDDSPFDLGS